MIPSKTFWLNNFNGFVFSKLLSSPVLMVPVVVDKPVFRPTEIFDVRVEADEADECTGNSWWKKLFGFVEHTPMFDKVFRKSGRGRVGGCFLHAGIDFTRNQSSAMNRGLSLRKLFLEHLSYTQCAQLGYAIWSVVRKASAHSSNCGKKQDSIPISVSFAKKRKQNLSEVKWSIHIDIHYSFPASRVKFHHFFTRCVDTSVMDEGAENSSIGFYCICNSLARLCVTDISLNANH
mmetsp:Transcript_4679/g.6624  ORF Transcript_4679/g.6624 Transcript_4679/m.6624 type:complete len:234 (-) Transcript_4679:270-971(-)